MAEVDGGLDVLFGRFEQKIQEIEKGEKETLACGLHFLVASL